MERLPPIVVVSNQKGGVGKTTTAVNVAAFAALAGRQVLLIDNDPQGNATSHVGGSCGELCLYNGAQPHATATPGLSLIPGGQACAEAEQQWIGHPQGARRFQSSLQPFLPSFDIVFVDCPPNLTWLPTNALRAASHLLIPVQSEYFALEGLSQLISFVAGLVERGETSIQRHQILLTMADASVPISRQIETDVRNHFGADVIPTVIPRDPGLSAAPSHGRPILLHDPLGPGAIAFLAVTHHLLGVLDERV